MAVVEKGNDFAFFPFCDFFTFKAQFMKIYKQKHQHYIWRMSVRKISALIILFF